MLTQTATPSNTAKPVSVAFLLGASDGESNAPFCPEMFFVRQCDKIQYSFGFELARGASEMTRQFTKSVNWGIARLPGQEPTLLVSRYANREGLADVQANYFLDGQYAAREGQPLAAMPTEYHEAGWWSANASQAERKVEGSIEDDCDWIRCGG